MDISIVTLLKDKVAGEQLKTLFMLPRYDHVFSVSSRSRREAFFWHFLFYWTVTAGEIKEHSVEESVDNMQQRNQAGIEPGLPL